MPQSACIIKMAQCSSHRACIIKMAQCSSHRACSIVVMCTSWQAEVMAARREEAVDTAQPKRAALISETRALQSQVYIYSTAHAELKRERRVQALLLAMCETRALVLEHSYSSTRTRASLEDRAPRTRALERSRSNARSDYSRLALERSHSSPRALELE